MAGYLAPTHGEARVLDAAPGDLDKLRGRVGVLPQDALLPDDRVGQFLRHCCRLQGMGASEADTEARARLEEVKGSDWWELRTGSLSHGMSKRVALAQALLGNPELVLLDEPTAGLDPRVAYEVRNIVKGRRGSCTLVISSHNLQELEEVCDAAAILDRGKLVGYGTISELTSATGEFHVEIALRGPSMAGGAPSLPIDPIRAIHHVKRVWVDDSRGLPRRRVRPRDGARSRHRPDLAHPPRPPDRHPRPDARPRTGTARDGADVTRSRAHAV